MLQGLVYRFKILSGFPKQYTTVSVSVFMSPRGVLAMFAYRGVHAMFLGLKFHLKAIFLGLKLNFPFFGGKNFQQLPFSLGSMM